MFRAVFSGLRRQRTGATRTTLAIGVIVGMLLTLVAIPAFASHYQASLEGSIFEIDDDANLVVNVNDNLDWANVDDTRKTDKATGQNDDSYGGGAKEDDTCPPVGTGSIPNNKSDLLNFGVYEEEGDPGFLHLFWTRVQEPSGTTLMDFELNQSGVTCANGVNKVRTGDGSGPLSDDLLIEYRIDQGGARASIKVRSWTGSAWGAAVDLTAVGAATGTINSTAITGANADGLGGLSARTFGEASLDLSYIFDPNKCTSFGSAFLKSRSSDAFTSQLKDFIAPVPIQLQNCGKVIIRKVTDPSTSPAFDFTKSFGTDPSSADTFQLAGGQSKEFTNVLFGEGYTVTEGTLPSGWDFVSIDCSASTGVTASITNRTVTFDIDDENDILDCTYSNRARGRIIVEKVADAAGSFGFTSTTLGAFSLSPTAAGTAGKASTTFSNLVPGTFDVAETVPAGWDLTGSSCSDGSPVNAISLQGGETITCTFTNVRQTGAIEITKTRKHAADGPLDYPHQGVTFTITGGNLPAGGATVTTNANGKACLDGLILSSFVGTYTVVETVPAGYQADSPGATRSGVQVTQKSTCGDGKEAKVSFSNTPLTDITVAVASQVAGGTRSSVSCVQGETVLGGTDGLYVDDPETELTDLLPGTYVCTVVVDP